MPLPISNQINEYTTEYEIQVSRDDFDTRTKSETNKVASTAYLKGFRKGKTPSSVITQRFGTEIKNQVLMDLINENFREIIYGSSETPTWYSDPAIEDGEDETAYNIKFRVEYFPTLNDVSLDGLELKKPVVEVTDSFIDSQIDFARKECTNWYELDGGRLTIQRGDRVTLQNTIENDREDDENEVRPIEIVIGDDEREVAQSRDSRLIGLAKGDEIEWDDAQLFALEKEEAAKATNAVHSVVEKIEVGHIPSLDEQLLHDETFLSRVGLQEYPTSGMLVAQLRNTLKSKVTVEIEGLTTTAIQRQILKALILASQPALPRETLKRILTEKVGMFGGLLELSDSFSMSDEDLDQLYAKKTEDWIRNRLKSSESNQSDQDDLGFEVRVELLTNMFERAIEESVAMLAQEICLRSFLEHKNLEPDDTWIREQIELESARVDPVMESEKLDEIYSEEHFEQLKEANLQKQVFDTIKEKANVVDWSLDMETFEQEVRDLLNQDGDMRDALKVTAALPPLETQKPKTEEIGDTDGSADEGKLAELSADSKTEEPTDSNVVVDKGVFKFTNRLLKRFTSNFKGNN